MTFRIVAGEAEGHRCNGDAGFVVEGLTIDRHPFTESVAGSVVEGEARLVNANSRRLADDAEPRGGPHVQNRPGTMWQVRFTEPAGANLAEQTFKRAAGCAFARVRRIRLANRTCSQTSPIQIAANLIYIFASQSIQIAPQRTVDAGNRE